MLLFARNEVLEAYHSPEDLEAAGKFGYSYFQDKEQYREFINSVKKKQKKLKEDQILFRTQFDDVEDLAVIQKLLANISQALIDVFAFFNMTNPQFTKGLEDHLANDLEQDDLSEAVAVLTAPVEKSMLHHEEEDFFKLLLKYEDVLPDINLETITDYKEFKDALDSHIKKYGHLSGNEGADHWDLQHYIGLLRDCLDSKVNLSEKVTELSKAVENARVNKEEFINKHRLEMPTVYVADCLANLGRYRLELRILWSAYFRMLRELVYKISRLTQIPAYTLLALSPGELVQIDFSKEDIEDSFKTKDRYKAYLFLVKNDVLTKSVYGDSAIAEFNKLVPKPNYDAIKEIEGNTAFPGVVEGKAYCMNWGDKDFNKKVKSMPEGAILVIGNTRPSLMPAIRKSSAIVTNEGGITSHAAIVSRELKIPCVIGTKSATKIIKTGDKVKVNAVKGIVEVVE
ncbi:hypothetical protein GF360_03460 [candidate division WWE3 bacterium]|nr:hypothetical protein [candidate division WWE3 bacterium]